jgi:hypothetical protein
MSIPAALAGELAEAQSAYVEASTRRRRAIVAAVAAGGSLRAVAEAANTSHESIRRLLAEASGVELRFEGVRYPLSFHEASALAGQLDDLAARFEADAGAETWSGRARRLEGALRSGLGSPEPLPLDRDDAAVLHQLFLLGPPPRARMVRLLLELVSDSLRA